MGNDISRPESASWNNTCICFPERNQGLPSRYGQDGRYSGARPYQTDRNYVGYRPSDPFENGRTRYSRPGQLDGYRLHDHRVIYPGPHLPPRRAPFAQNPIGAHNRRSCPCRCRACHDCDSKSDSRCTRCRDRIGARIAYEQTRRASEQRWRQGDPFSPGYGLGGAERRRAGDFVSRNPLDPLGRSSDRRRHESSFGTPDNPLYRSTRPPGDRASHPSLWGSSRR